MLRNQITSRQIGLAVIVMFTVANIAPQMALQSASGQVLYESAKLVASDGEAGDHFGLDQVSIDGDTAVIGSPKAHVSGIKSGAAYVFVRSGGVWTQQAKLIPPDPTEDQRFGTSVSISGATVVIGARLDDEEGSDAGAAYVFTRSAGVWTQQQKITANDAVAGDDFGFSASLDGNTAVIGARLANASGSDSGAAYVFVRAGGLWTQQAKLIGSHAAAGSSIGHSVSISSDTALISAHGDGHEGFNLGAVYVFVRSGVVWTQQARLIAADTAAGDHFGLFLAISGDTAVIGAIQDDDAGTDAGAAYIFVRSGAVWSQQDKLTAGDAAPGDEFSNSVAISGDTTVIGAVYNDEAGSDAGAAYVFVRSGATWTQAAKLIASDAAADDHLGGSAASISGDTALFGAYSADASAVDSGAAYVFDLVGAPMIVHIDIKPGSSLNSINLGSRGVIPVAILTTAEFDAAEVDPDTVQLAGSGVALRGNGSRLLASLVDVDHDGDLDLMLHVSTDNLQLQVGATTAVLTGLTWDGEAIEGSDTVNIVPP